MSSRSKATKGTASSSSGRGKAKLTAGAAAAVASVSNNKSRTGRSPVGGASSTKSTKVTRKRLHQAAAEEDDDGATAADSQPVGGDAVSLARLQLATPQSSPSKKARSRSGDSKAAPASSRVLFGNDSAPGSKIRGRRPSSSASADSDEEPVAAAAVEDPDSDDQPGEPQDEDGELASEHEQDEPNAAAGDNTDDVLMVAASSGAADSTSDSSDSGSESDQSDSDASSAEDALASVASTSRGRRSKGAGATSKSAPHTPMKKGTAASASSPASPVKKWVQPITTTAFASASGKVSASAKQFNVSPMVVGDVGSAMNNASRVLRKSIILRNLDWDGKDESDGSMILTGFGDDVPKYLNNMQPDKCYTVDLEKQSAPVGKPLCIDGHTHYFKLAANSNIREYETIDKVEDKRQAVHMELLFGSSPISSARVCEAGAQVNVLGVVMKVSAHPMKNGAGLKIILADESCYINVMFFEPKANIVVGTSLAIVGAKVWKNNKTGATELSCWNTTVVETNLKKLSKDLLKRARNGNYDGLTNVSQVPSEEPRLMSDLIEEAAQLESDNDQIHATVLLHLDPVRPTNGGNITYNSCVQPQCKRKVKPINEQDADGNDLYDHDVDRGDSHKSTTYACRYFFNGRFKEDDAAPVYLGQVDDALGETIFGCTADELSALEEEARTALLQKAATHSYKFNVVISKAGAIASMIMV